jgi:hypothetical protein
MWGCFIKLGREEEGEEEVLTSSIPSPPHYILGYPRNNNSKEIMLTSCQQSPYTIELYMLNIQPSL